MLLGLCIVLGAGALLGGATLMLGDDGGEAVGEPAPVADIEVGGRPNLITPTDVPSPTTSAPTPSSTAGARPASSPSSSPAPPPVSSPAPATASVLVSSSPSSRPTTAATPTPTPTPTPSETWRDRDNCRDDRDHSGGGRWDRDDCEW
ncbi:hypothetical protein GLX30_20575 [Streptomyces sp. Tu 2975]|uniref:hypothetical protein n=1 Tax=Streptomyces sp. Tu 2975 TaxID=2676871 RepID=UPI001359B3F1|nr:hypothetical protein [Streptomyces sp. Tu 2975]QIP86032.1 hypothetical protein GLX30_20575 [Streptomyces sp. Tu 2975]